MHVLHEITKINYSYIYYIYALSDLGVSSNLIGLLFLAKC